MAASVNIAQPIYPHRVLSGGAMQAAMRRIAEKATQTFLIGTPVQIEVASGFIIACAAIVSAATAFIAGFASEFASNLTTSGVAKTLTQGTVQNQPLAFPIPVGVAPNDGTVGLHEAIDETLFVGVLGHSGTAALAITAQTMLGAIFGLTKDATNLYWYIDMNITTVANGACVQITDFVDPVGTLNGKLEFKVLHAACQLSGN
jgi:hypothetical protein